MWTKERITEDLQELRILPGDSVLVHSSMRALGAVEGGADSVIEALLEAVGPEGTVAAPTFANARKTAESEAVPNSDSVAIDRVGILPARLLQHDGSARSGHRALSFTAVGKNAGFITSEAPFHYPLGSNSPLAKLYQLNAGILLLGVGHEANSAIHLAEVWADVPYGRRKAVVLNEKNEWQDMFGSPECSRGFHKIEPVLRQARILREGYVGNAPSQFMRIQHAVSLAIEMLKGDPEALLCDNGDCPHCTLARRFAAKQDSSRMRARRRDESES